MPMITRIHHIAILVENFDVPLEFWREALGLEITPAEQMTKQEALVAELSIGESNIELVKPTTQTSGIAKYLRKRGPGMHHICFEVDDLMAYLNRLKALGIRLINPEPVIGAQGKRVAFIHPESTHGVLVELCECPKDEMDA